MNRRPFTPLAAPIASQVPSELLRLSTATLSRDIRSRFGVCRRTAWAAIEIARRNAGGNHGNRH